MRLLILCCMMSWACAESMPWLETETAKQAYHGPMASSDAVSQVPSVTTESSKPDEPTLKAWVMHHIPLILSTDYVNDRVHQMLIAYAFTADGLQAFNQWHQGFMEAIMHNDLIVKAMVQDGVQLSLKDQRAHADIPVRLMLIGQSPSQKKVVLTRDLKLDAGLVWVNNQVKIDGLKVLAHEQ